MPPGVGEQEDGDLLEPDARWDLRVPGADDDFRRFQRLGGRYRAPARRARQSGDGRGDRRFAGEGQFGFAHGERGTQGQLHGAVEQGAERGRDGSPALLPRLL